MAVMTTSELDSDGDECAIDLSNHNIIFEVKQNDAETADFSTETYSLNNSKLNKGYIQIDIPANLSANIDSNLSTSIFSLYAEISDSRELISIGTITYKTFTTL